MSLYFTYESRGTLKSLSREGRELKQTTTTTATRTSPNKRFNVHVRYNFLPLSLPKKILWKRRFKSTDVSALCVLRGNVETSVDLYRYYRVFSTILSTFTCSFKKLRSFPNSISTGPERVPLMQVCEC